MALSKNVELDNGVVVCYHRVVSVNTITNVQNIVEVASYTSEDKRDEEIEAIENGDEMSVYINTMFFNTEYDQSMTVEGAYEYLKTLPEFSDAEDV